jgi:hypothetical protein
MCRMREGRDNPVSVQQLTRNVQLVSTQLCDLYFVLNNVIIGGEST